MSLKKIVGIMIYFTAFSAFSSQNCSYSLRNLNPKQKNEPHSLSPLTEDYIIKKMSQKGYEKSLTLEESNYVLNFQSYWQAATIESSGNTFDSQTYNENSFLQKMDTDSRYTFPERIPMVSGFLGINFSNVALLDKNNVLIYEKKSKSKNGIQIGFYGKKKSIEHYNNRQLRTLKKVINDLPYCQ